MSEEGGQAPEPHTNGPVDLEEEDAEAIKARMRPADIDQDMREMERRKRVEMIMGSRMFRDELERIIETQLREGYNPVNLMALHQLYDAAGLPAKFSGSVLKGGGGCVIPVADIRGYDSLAYAKGEKLARCKLAATYRLIDLFGWSQGIYNHITLRVNQDQEHFLINPFGLMYHEVTASSLVKVDMQGNVIDPGTTNFGVNVAGFTLHSAIHAARPDIKSIIHIHTSTVTAVASLKCGLMPVCQEAAIIGDVSYHDYQGILVNQAEKDVLARNLGPVNKVMLLRNHGAVCCGETIEEAQMLTILLVQACEAQLQLMPYGVDNMVLISEEARQKAYQTARKSGGGGVDSHTTDGGGVDGSTSEGEQQQQPKRRWKFGEMEFEANMRMLDNAGYRTGYMYRQPLTKSDVCKNKCDVEVPPASSSYSYIFDESDLFKYSPLKKILESRRSTDKTRWLNSPNVYNKVEVLETGTNNPKKITKWVPDDSPTHSQSNPTKVDSALQFVPKDTDPKEFKKKQKQIKANRRADKITAGPQSHLLEGVTWEEARKLQDATVSGTGDQVVLVGAASKGIIQRDFQHHAVVYKSPYAKNPFDNITDEEIEEYRKVVEKKQRGESVEDDTTLPADTTTDTAGETTADEQGATVHSPIHSPVSPSEVEDEDESSAAMAPKPSRVTSKGEPTVNGDETDARGQDSEFSPTDKEGSPSKDISTEDSSPKKKERKKKKGIRTPSFLKKKKDKEKKKDKHEA